MTKTQSRLVLLALIAFAVSGCASTSGNRDPFEPVNRRIYQVNDAVDNALLKPVAIGYQTIVPTAMQDGVGNFFSNINDVIVVVNDLLQGKFSQGLSDTGRFLVNSTVGLLGLVDVGTRIGLTKHNEDFGQTLGYWGLEPGPYLVLPLFGPSNMRDGVGLVADFALDVVSYLNNVPLRNALTGVRTVDTRADFLRAGDVLEQASLDRYTFLRDAYLQRRRNLVYDGSPPLEPLEEFEDFEDDAAPATAPDPAGSTTVDPEKK